MTNISQWNTTDDNNTSAAPAGAPEGMLPSAVNDTLRAILGAAARCYEDIQGNLVTAGTGTAYTLTTNNAHAALADIGAFVVRWHTSSTGAATLAVDSLAAKSIVRADGTAIASGTLPTNGLSLVCYNVNQDSFYALSTVTTLDGIRGLVPSNNGTDADHDLDFTAGYAAKTDGTDGVSISALTKRFDATFAAGTNNGALGDSVTLPTSGTIHAIAIKNDSTGAADIMADTSASGANAPSGWSAIRRIASFTTDGSSNIEAIYANEVFGGGLFVGIGAPVVELSTTTSASRTTLALDAIPTGAIHIGWFDVFYNNPASAGNIVLYATDGAPSDFLAVLEIPASGRISNTFQCVTNSSAQIDWSASQNATNIRIRTMAYVDSRVT